MRIVSSIRPQISAPAALGAGPRDREEWAGGRVEDPLDDFIGRCMCTFWRLIG
ncbi:MULTISPECIES: hypothetical protein [Streptomyces]|uniref:hypothetical protein n=1 Tax=Streptomyces TaxID=1883 RepID=UPI002E17B8C0|nr:MULTISPECIES: hypothetical protein [unclassified Streptomyces]